MNITKNIINDLIPLYFANECSADTRALVEEYLQQYPEQAAMLRRIASTPVPGTVPPAKNLDEASFSAGPPPPPPPVMADGLGHFLFARAVFILLRG